MKKEPLYILDGYALIYKSYYAFITRPLMNDRAENISAFFGFYRSLFAFFREYKPKRFLVALDPATKTFRHEMYPEYKANREKAPDDLHAQVPNIIKQLDNLGINHITVNGFEADDVMATVAHKIEKESDVYVITGDKDLLQLVDSRVHILKPVTGGYEDLTPEEVKNSKGINPDQVVDWLALIGDSADNVPGVAGIGPKGAVKLLDNYGTLESIYENIENIKAAGQKKKLIEGKENAFFSKKLVTVSYEVPIGEEKDFLLGEPNDIDVINLFEKVGSDSLVRDFKNIKNPSNNKKSTIIQPDLIETEQTSILKREPKGNYTVLLKLPEIKNWLDSAKDSLFIAFDCETDSLDAVKANPVGICLSVKPCEAVYIPLKIAGTELEPVEDIKELLIDFFEKRSGKLIGHNIKYDYKVMKQWGVDIGSIYWDTMIAGWMIDSSSRVSMDHMAAKYLSYKTVHFEDIVKKGETFDSVPLEQALEYAAEDADITLRLFKVTADLLNERGLSPLFFDVEMPLVKILGDMELEGIQLDKNQLDLFHIELADSIKLLETSIFELAGKEFKIGSPKQLQEILFVDRKLTPIKKIKTGFSTDTKVLEQLASQDPIAEKVIIWRALSKLKSTYVDALPKLINKKSGRIHTNFNQTGTATGRLSSKDPNLQNIPIRDDNGRRIREAFIPKDGYGFVSADYSQIELVVLAELSNDSGLKESFLNGLDVHKRTASLIFKVDESEISDDQRRIAKTINFGVMYGMSAFRLANELKIPRKDAAEFIDSYFTTYSGIKKFISDTVLKAEEDGGVHTLFGRFRPIPGINSRNKTEKMGAERAAVNSRIQGTAADIMKKAMIAIDKTLHEHNIDGKMLLQVHDEAILEVKKDEMEKVSSLIKETMESIINLSIPLKSSVECGFSWGEIH